MPRAKRVASDPKEPTRAVGYARVSTADQGESGLGLDAQRLAILRECDRRSWELLQTFSDIASGSSTNGRAQLTAALDLLDSRRASVLVAARLDRLTRSVLDFSALVERSRSGGWSIVVLDVNVDTSTAMGEAMANMAVTFAQLERRLIGERTAAALAIAKERGVQLGRPRTVPDEVRGYITSMRSQGLTLRAIAETLNDEGVPTGQGGSRWYASTVSGVLNRDDGG